MSRPLGLVGTVGGSALFGGAPPGPTYTPFTLVNSITVNIATPCGATSELFFFDFIQGAGQYENFLVGKAEAGPFGASVTFSCAELGDRPTYIQGTPVGGGTPLVKSTLTQVSDGSFFCDGC